VDTAIKVVNLGSEICEVILTSIEVKSDQGERTMVDGSVNTHIDPAHEAHVGIKEEFFRRPVRIGRGSGALHKGHAHLPFKSVIDDGFIRRRPKASSERPLRRPLRCWL